MTRRDKLLLAMREKAHCVWEEDGKIDYKLMFAEILDEYTENMDIVDSLIERVDKLEKLIK